MSHSTTATLAAVLTALAVTSGCNDAAKPPVAPTQVAAAPPPAPPLAPATPGKTNSSVYLSDRLRQACGITTVETVKEAPKFDFDQNMILPEDRDVLAKVATCLTTG